MLLHLCHFEIVSFLHRFDYRGGFLFDSGVLKLAFALQL